MSQWGATASRGRAATTSRSSATTTGTRSVARGGASVVRVLLQANRSSVSFTGATRAGGGASTRNPSTRRRATGEASCCAARRGRALARLRRMSCRCQAEPRSVCSVQAGNGVRNGLYRGSLEIRVAAGSGLNAINTLGIENYLPAWCRPRARRSGRPRRSRRRRSPRAPTPRDRRRRKGLRPVPRHAQPGVPRVQRRDGGDEQRGRLHQPARS